jgi:hypothetical protein
VRHDTPTPRGRRVGLIAATAATFLLAACSGPRPTTSDEATVGATSAPITAMPAASASTVPAWR